MINYRLKTLSWVGLVGLLMFFCMPSNIHAEGELLYELSFSADDISFSKLEGYDAVELPDCIFTRDAGKPRLPSKIIHFALDDDKKPYKVEIASDIHEEIEGTYNLYPAQESVPYGEERVFTPPDPSVYKLHRSYPKRVVEIKAQGCLSGTNIASLNIYPLQYIPGRKKLVLHTNITVKLIQKTKDKADKEIQKQLKRRISKTPKGKKTIKEMLNKLVVNPESIEQQFEQDFASAMLESAPFETIDYLIITNEALKQAQAYQPLINSKTTKGLSVLVESVEDIKQLYSGRDAQEKIRNYIKEKHIQSGLTWVLLGGDTNIVPVRFVKTLNSSEIISDMYYSDLDGDWDADGDSIFGEFDDVIDLYPDVFVGRAPVEDEAEARVFVDKVLTYEANIPSYAETALFLGGNDFNDVGGRIKDFIEYNYMPEDFKLITKYYERDIPVYRELTIQALNEGYHLINHIGHATTESLFTGDDYLTISDIDELANSSFPAIIWSCGCHPAEIDHDCIAEYWVTNPNGGGAAFIGNSGFGLNPESDSYLDPSFYESLFFKGLTHIGQTLADSKITFISQANTSPSMRYAMFELNLLGDPQMHIQIDTDRQIYISAPAYGSYIKGGVDIIGSAYLKDHFYRYELYYAPKDNPSDASLIYSSSDSVQDHFLTAEEFAWDTTQCEDGEYLLILKIITVSGKEIECNQNIEVVIDNQSQAPEFINLGNKGAVIDLECPRPFEFKVKARDPDNPETEHGQLEYSAEIPQYLLDRGAVFEPETQLFSWTPREADKGIYEVSFSVSDNEHIVTQTIALTTVVVKESPVCLDPADQMHPVVYGHRIIWDDHRNREDCDSIYMYDILKKEESSLNISCSPYSRFALYNNRLSFCKDQDIYLYDFVEQREIPVCTDPSYQFAARHWGDMVVWMDERNGNYDIYMYDLLNETEVPICINPGPQYNPDIYDTKIVWHDYRSGDYDIYMYDLNEPNEGERPICTAIAGQLRPRIFKNNVVWTDGRNGFGDIYLYNLATETERQLTTGPAEQTSPAICEDRIVWEDRRNYDIYLYELSTNTEVQITGDPDIQYDPAIYQDIVVWGAFRVGEYNHDIYMAKIYFVPQLSSLSKTSALSGQTLTIYGKNFGWGQNQDEDSSRSRVQFTLLGCFGEFPAGQAEIVSWSNTKITCRVPNINPGPYKITVITPGGESNFQYFTVLRPYTPPPTTGPPATPSAQTNTYTPRFPVLRRR